MSILAWIVLGLVAGWLASMIMGSNFGVLGTILLGIVGAVVGGWLGSALFGVDVNGLNLESLLVALVGSIVVIGIARALSPGRATYD